MNTLTDDVIYIGVPLGLVLAGWIWLRYFVKPKNNKRQSSKEIKE